MQYFYLKTVAQLKILNKDSIIFHTLRLILETDLSLLYFLGLKSFLAMNMRIVETMKNECNVFEI